MLILNVIYLVPFILSDFLFFGTWNWELSQILFGQKSPKTAIVYCVWAYSKNSNLLLIFQAEQKVQISVVRLWTVRKSDGLGISQFQYSLVSQFLGPSSEWKIVCNAFPWVVNSQYKSMYKESPTNTVLWFPLN